MSSALGQTWLQATRKSGQVVDLIAPTTVDTLMTALGRISQDLRDEPVTRDAFISLRPHDGNGVSVITGGSRADFKATSPDEFGCAGAFIQAVGYVRETLQCPEERVALDGILINRLPERKAARILTAAQANQFLIGG